MVVIVRFGIMDHEIFQVLGKVSIHFTSFEVSSRLNYTNTIMMIYFFKHVIRISECTCNELQAHTGAKDGVEIALLVIFDDILHESLEVPIEAAEGGMFQI